MASAPGILFFEAITPVHMGAGSSLSHIDLPIQRNQVTGLPIFQSSGIKGAMRAWTREICNGDKDCLDKLLLIFGPEPYAVDNQEDRAGLLGITDAELLFFPVASEPGVFCFVTCPMVLMEFYRKVLASGLADQQLIEIFAELPAVTANDALVSSNFPDSQSTIIWLLDLPFEVGRNCETLLKHVSIFFADLFFTSEDPMREKFMSNLVVVEDSVFTDLTSEGTEVRNRIKVDYETGTVQEGALWTEEFLPVHSLMYSLSFFNSRNQELTPNQCYSFFQDHNLCGRIHQIGGDQTLGHGLVKISWHYKPAGYEGDGLSPDE